VLAALVLTVACCCGWPIILAVLSGISDGLHGQ
jgi:hypothetical protein